LRVAKIISWIFVGIIFVCCLLIVSIDERMPDSPVIRVGRARAQISAFITALDVYRLDTGELPTTTHGLQALRHNPGVKGWRGPYLPTDIPLDPWKREYQYRRYGDGKAEVLSFGPKSGANSSPIIATTSPATLIKE
jgi:type II secretion system protein G